MKKRIGILIPCFNEEETIRKTVFLTENTLLDAPKEIEYIYLFVDDGSSDNTKHELESVSNSLTRECRIFILSRNFGKEAAMLAGLENSQDLDGIIFMDADGQDPPEAIVKMSELFLTGLYDDIYAKRSGRKDSSFLKRKLITWHYKILNKFSSFPIAEDVGDYRLLNRKAMNEVIKLKEKCRYTKGLFAFIGLRKKSIQIFRENRIGGNSSWNFKKQVSFAIDSLINFTNLPTLIMAWGFFLSVICSLLLGLSLYFKNNIENIIFIGIILGINSLWLVGWVLSKMLHVLLIEIKDRPIYIISSVNVLPPL